MNIHHRLMNIHRYTEQDGPYAWKLVGSKGWYTEWKAYSKMRASLEPMYLSLSTAVLRWTSSGWSLFEDHTLKEWIPSSEAPATQVLSSATAWHRRSKNPNYKFVGAYLKMLRWHLQHQYSLNVACNYLFSTIQGTISQKVQNHPGYDQSKASVQFGRERV